MKVLYFASLREAVGLSSEQLSLPEVHDVKSLMQVLASRGGVWQQQFDGSRQIRAAVNQVLAHDAATIKGEDEVAFFPPVTGG